MHLLVLAQVVVLAIVGRAVGPAKAVATVAAITPVPVEIANVR